MTKGVLLRLLLCVSVFALYLYQVIQKQNVLNYFSLQIPRLGRDVKSLEEENTKYRFEIEKFESPQNLIQLARTEQFTNLRYPSIKEILSLPEGIALKSGAEPDRDDFKPYQDFPVLAARERQE